MGPEQVKVEPAARPVEEQPHVVSIAVCSETVEVGEK
jgi:hypothetical protein